MLGGEPFGDRPPSVCPALRAFLHGYNDRLSDQLRQELYGLASDIVGTHGPTHVTAWRARLCVGWGRSLAPLENVPTSFRHWTLANCALAGEYSADAARRNRWCHQQTLAFFRWLAHARAPLPAHRSHRPHPLDAGAAGSPHLPLHAPGPLQPAGATSTPDSSRKAAVPITS